jgi:two-component system, OmpR family, sensor histidine kinase KdpD
MEDERPSPEEMLKRAAEEEARERRGRLKIFFGASPGVGKTYSMLEAAKDRRRDGIDVVIGWVDTHGRAETEKLTEGFERLPPRDSEHRGIVLREFDVDAALKRRPGLLIVDELAHTNAPGSRHARRWQDVEEILDAGMDVSTTLNVQHLESMNDVVARITGVVVHETVPDTIFDRASEIEMIDLPPDDLLQRLREGKVYLPAEAERAQRNFFRKGNLIALRELALRRTAERVDEQVAQYKKEQGIAQPWPTRERLLVVVGPAPQSANVVRAAYRMAARLKAPWIALSIETPAYRALPEEERELVGAHLELAERLGAETLVIQGERVSEEVLAVAREQSVTRIIVGKPTHGRWRDWIRGSIIEELVRGSGEVDVLVTTGSEEEAWRPPPVLRSPRVHGRQFLDALAVVGAATILCVLTRSLLTLADQAMIYLLGVLIVSSRMPRRPSLVAAIASVMALDFFFVPPYYSLDISDLRYIVTFSVMMVVALTVSTLTVRIREQAEAARQRERRTAALYAMSREFSVQTEVGGIARTAATHVRNLMEAEVFVLLEGSDGRLRPVAGGELAQAKSERELAVAQWVFDHGRPAGSGTDTLPASESLFFPLTGTRGPLGVFGVVLGSRGAAPAPSRAQLLETYVAQTALAVERALLEEEADRARVGAETEQARSALLSAVSHDLRTPLASMTGSVGVLLDHEKEMKPGERRELLETIREEGDRLGRLVNNLLELTRLESGALQVRKEWYPLEEVISSSLGRLGARVEGRQIVVDLPQEVLLAPVDPVLLEQVFINLLENALKYSPPGSPIEIGATLVPGELVVEIADRGAGLPPGEEERVFERFYRVADGRRAEGAGLGLAVCQAILKVHGGRISAENRSGGGAVFRFTLPLTGTPPPPEEPADARALKEER